MGNAFLLALERAGAKDRKVIPCPIVCTCQMFGSGKTTLGREFSYQFQKQLSTNAEKYCELKKRFGKELQKLSNALYVYVDLSVCCHTSGF